MSTTQAPCAFLSGRASSWRCACARPSGAISRPGTRFTTACCARSGSSIAAARTPATGGDAMESGLLLGAQTRLAATNWQADAEAKVAAAWSSDPEFQRLFDARPARQVTAEAFKKGQASAEADQGAREWAYSFAIRALADDRLLGFVDLEIQP